MSSRVGTIRKPFDSWCRDNDPDLLKEWHPTRNLPITPSSVGIACKEKLWWLGKCGHEWQATIGNRRKSGCPICTNRRVLPGFNDLATTNPELIAQWHPTKNGSLKPTDIVIGSNKKVWWICEKGHSYDAIPYDRKVGKGCPYCAGKRVLRGYNDLVSQCPDIAAEWDYDKNEKQPEDVIKGSNSYAYWKCKNGHSWKAVISSRTGKGHYGCPYCAGQRVITGQNDLLTLRPEIASQWHPTNNGDLKPEKVMAGSNKKVWWLCDFGHEWQAPPSERLSGRGCPECASEMRVSFNEKAIAYYLGKTQHVEESAHLPELGKMELDVYLPELSVAVEYDGVAFHKDKKRDLKKNSICTAANIALYRVREKGCPEIDGCVSIQLGGLATDDIEAGIKRLLVQITHDTGKNCFTPVDLKSDYNTILEMKTRWDKDNSFEKTHPDIASEWHPTKNGRLRPSMFKSHSNRRFWWQCKEGHEWEAKICDRVDDNTGCPICSNRVIIPGVNDFKKAFPDLAEEWDYSKNKKGPDQYAPYSNKVAYWICKNGHQYRCQISNRANGGGCPVCSGKHVLPGFNDIKSQYPSIAKYWDYSKNEKGPEQYVRNANVLIHFKCDKGHEWTATLNGIRDEFRCPFCSGRRAYPGDNDLATLCPEIAKFWDYDKNSDGPENYRPQSNANKYWKCEKGHRYKKKISEMYKGKGCPICSNTKVLTGYNDLESKYPLLAKQWHPTKNGELLPTQIVRGGNKSYWWMCEKGHSWQATVTNRIHGTGCPYCSGNLPVSGVNDFKTLYPEIAKEWHPTKNGDLKPEQILPKSNKKVWWQCKKGHEWEAKTVERTSRGYNCPYCSGRRVLSGFNDLETTDPIIARQWHPNKNQGLKPSEVSRGSHKRVWWLCEKGHEWEAEINTRASGKGCPFCYNEKRIQKRVS